MEFYTNVIQRGNSLLVRGVEDGQRVSKRVNYRPTLFNKVNEYTGYRTLDGQHVLPKELDSIKEAKAWVEQRSQIKISCMVIHNIHTATLVMSIQMMCLGTKTKSLL